MKKTIKIGLIFSLLCSSLHVYAASHTDTFPVQVTERPQPTHSFNRKVRMWAVPIVSTIAGACFIGLGFEKISLLNSDQKIEEYRSRNFANLSNEEGKKETVLISSVESILGFIIGITCLTYSGYKIYQYNKKRKNKQKL